MDVRIAGTVVVSDECEIAKRGHLKRFTALDVVVSQAFHVLIVP